MKCVTAVGDRVFFTAVDDNLRHSLWVSDATFEGTSPLMTFGQIHARLPMDFVGVGDHLFFTAEDDLHGREIWTADGTAAGTRIALDAEPGPSGAESDYFSVFDDVMLYRSRDTIHGREPWIGFGATGEISLLDDVLEGTEGSNPKEFALLGNTLFFRAYSPDYGYELWKMEMPDGAPAMIADTNPGKDNSYPRDFLAWQGELWYTLYHPQIGRELWKTDGTRRGTSSVVNFSPGRGSIEIAEMTPVGNRLFISLESGDDLASNSLWVLDEDRDPHHLFTFHARPPTQLTPFRDGIVFEAVDRSLEEGRAFGSELWRSDGTPEGTAAVIDLAGFGSGSPSDLMIHNDLLYFRSRDYGGLYVSDGTEEGTYKYSRNWPVTIDREMPAYFAKTDHHLFFVGSDDIHGRELWAINLDNSVAPGSWVMYE